MQLALKHAYITAHKTTRAPEAPSFVVDTLAKMERQGLLVRPPRDELTPQMKLDSTMSEYTIRLIGGTEDEEATIIAAQARGMCRILCTYRGQTIQAAADDYFEAFCKIRLLLEKDHLLPFCYGASLNVIYPSDIMRDRTRGLEAYKLRAGVRPTSIDRVPIFDEGPDVVPVPVAQQMAFYEDWLMS
jgi:hypothetical protein